MSVTASSVGHSRNATIGSGLVGGAWQTGLGWCELAPDGNITAHYHCETCGVCMFTQRSDARYHSNACRQRAYRARHGMLEETTP